MRVLVVAEACNPEWTSVPLVGFNMANSLAALSDVDVTLVTHVRNRNALQRNELSNRVEIVYINNEWIAKPLYHLGKVLRGGASLGWTTNMAVNWLSYVTFEKMVYRQLSKRLAAGEFDLIHRVTPVSPTMPSPLASLTKVPMIIGPLNGGLPWPKQFPSLHRQEREWLAPVRNAYRKLPYYRSTYRNLAAVISGSRHTQTEVPTEYSGQRFYMPENGIDPERFEIAEAWTPPTDRFRFVTVGRLVPYKGIDMILSAMAESPILRSCHLEIIGDGPQRAALEQQTAESGLNHSVTFSGWMPQHELARNLRNSQAFAFPSLREFGGGVVLEAMASGLPSIVVNHGGPAELVDENNGILLPLTERETLVTNLIAAMEKLATNSQLSERLGHNAIQTVVQRFTWSRKAEQVKDIYHEVLGTSAVDFNSHRAEQPGTLIHNHELCAAGTDGDF